MKSTIFATLLGSWLLKETSQPASHYLEDPGDPPWLLFHPYSLPSEEQQEQPRSSRSSRGAQLVLRSPFMVSGAGPAHRMRFPISRNPAITSGTTLHETPLPSPSFHINQIDTKDGECVVASPPPRTKPQFIGHTLDSTKDEKHCDAGDTGAHRCQAR
ncbi:unnamed protein product [Lota lota]